jgi:hypothetical protein
MRILAATLALLSLTACMTARVQLSEKWDRRTPPAYVDYFDFYGLGLWGDATVDLQKVCMDQRPHGFEKIKSAEDTVLTYFTLGIYSPVTVKVWCGE